MRVPSKHDHYGHMIFERFRARCTGCGQVWVLARRGPMMRWEPR